LDGVDVEAATLHRSDRLRIEHEVVEIGVRYQNSLGAAQAYRFTHAVKAFDFLVDTADCLHRPVLVDRARHCKVLAQWHVAERGEQRIKLRRAGAVAVDARIGLLESDARRHRDGQALPETMAEKSAKDHDSLVVSRT